MGLCGVWSNHEGSRALALCPAPYAPPVTHLDIARLEDYVKPGRRRGPVTRLAHVRTLQAPGPDLEAPNAGAEAVAWYVVVVVGGLGEVNLCQHQTHRSAEEDAHVVPNAVSTDQSTKSIDVGVTSTDVCVGDTSHM